MYESLVNRMFCISCMPESELCMASKIYEDIEFVARVQGLRFQVLRPKNVLQFEALLINIAKYISVNNSYPNLTKSSMYPIIQIDAHGHEYRGLKVSEKEYVSWARLRYLLSEINSATSNCLTVFLPVCYSYKVLEDMNIHTPAIASVLLYSNGKIIDGEILGKLPKVYERLLHGDFIAPKIQDIVGATFEIFESESQSYEGLIEFSKENNNSWKQKNTLVNKMINEFHGSGNFNPNDIGAIRNNLKKGIVDDKLFLMMILKTFLCNKFTCDEITIRYKMYRGALNAPP